MTKPFGNIYDKALLYLFSAFTHYFKELKKYIFNCEVFRYLISSRQEPCADNYNDVVFYGWDL